MAVLLQRESELACERDAAVNVLQRALAGICVYVYILQFVILQLNFHQQSWRMMYSSKVNTLVLRFRLFLLFVFDQSTTMPAFTSEQSVASRTEQSDANKSLNVPTSEVNAEMDSSQLKFSSDSNILVLNQSILMVFMFIFRNFVLKLLVSYLIFSRN